MCTFQELVELRWPRYMCYLAQALRVKERLVQEGKLREDSDFVVDVEQGGQHMLLGTTTAPPQITHGTLWSTRHNRVALTGEHLLQQGINVYPNKYYQGMFAPKWVRVRKSFANFPDISPERTGTAFTACSLKRMSGNGMNMANLLPVLLFTLSRAIVHRNSSVVGTPSSCSVSSSVDV